MTKIPTSSPEQSAIIDAFYAMQPGAFYRVQWTRQLKIRKSFPGVNITKHVSAMVKAGIEYDNKASVQAKRESGDLPSVNAGLPWGTWYDYPRAIEHKGQYYLRLYPANEFGRTVSTYQLTIGNVIRDCAEDEARTIALASELHDSDKPIDCFTVKLQNLIGFARV